MRFQTSRIIDGHDPEVILRALTTCLQEIPLDVVRDGSEIIVCGLGPSHHVIKRGDKAILRVESQGDRTIINADVSYQASSVLGDIQQDVIVGQKLESVFAQMDIEIAAEQRLEPLPPSSRIEKPVTLPDKSGRIYASPFASLPLASLDAPPEVSAKSHSPEASSGEKPKRNQLFFLPRSLRAHIVATSIVGLVLLALIFSLVWRHHAKIALTPSPVSQGTSHNVPTAPSASSSHPGVANPKMWLNDWASAMRTRDPASQASFYADPVDLYLGRQHVSNAEIYQDKKASIEKRMGLWTVKLEKLAIGPRRNNAVTVQLEKHYISQTGPGQILEWSVRSRLRLRRIDSQWKITSEENLPQAVAPVRFPVRDPAKRSHSFRR